MQYTGYSYYGGYQPYYPDNLGQLKAQQAQNATLTAAMSKNTSEILARTAPYPIPAYQVPNPYAGCGYASCGCGCQQ